MKSFLSLVFLVFITEPLFAQDGIKLTKDSDTSYWYSYKKAYEQQFQLESVEKDTVNYSFCFWSLGLVIKVAQDGSRSFGEIIRFVEEYPGTSKKKTFKKRYAISPLVASSIVSLIDSMQIERLPSDKNIKGWQLGLDGITYLVEYKRGNQYGFKNYWTPSAQDSIEEAIQVLNFITVLEKTLDLKNNSQLFEAAIPFDGWSYPGSGSAVLRVKREAKQKKGGG